MAIPTSLAAWNAGVGPVAAAFAAAAQDAAAAATMLYRTVSGLAPPAGMSFGRYFASGTPLIAFAAAATDVPSMIAQAASLRAAVATSAAALTMAEDPVSLANAGTALVAAVRAAAASPSDAIAILTRLVLFEAPAIGNTGDLFGAEILALAGDASWLLRRLAGNGLGRAAADYVPSSYQDASTTRDRVASLLDALALAAADQFDDGAYAGLCGLRNAVIADLTARGGSLAPIEEKTFGVNLPAPMVAWALYRDATRSADILARNDCPHPSFLPTTLEVLAA